MILIQYINTFLPSPMTEAYTPVNLIIQNEAPLRINVNPEETVGQFQERLLKMMELDSKTACQVSLGAPANTLDKNIFSLKDYGVQENMDIYFTLAANKGGNTCAFDFIDLKNKVERQFSQTAPDWRIACKGCNLQAKCQNQECSAYNKMVIIQKGFVKEINLAQQIYECVCPICKQQTQEAELLAYYNCNIEIKGRKANNQKFQFKDTANNGKYHRFEPEAGKSEVISWRYLKITATPLQ